MLRTRYSSEKGQALIEFSLVLPVLLVLVMGIVEFGWLYTGYLEIIHAGREGVRLASVKPYDEAAIVTRVQQTTQRFTVVAKDATSFSTGTPGDNQLWVLIDAPVLLPGKDFTIELKGGVGLLTPIIKSILGRDHFVAKSTAVMRIE